MRPQLSAGTFLILVLFTAMPVMEAATLDALWEFDGNCGAIPDSAWDGTAFGSVDFVAGVSGQAAHFEGGYLPENANPPVDHVDTVAMQVPNSDYVGGLSIMAWIKPSGSFGPILTHNKSCCGTSYWGFAFYWASGDDNLGLALANQFMQGMSGVLPPGDVPADEWTHVAATYDGYTTAPGGPAQGIQLYVNGYAVATQNVFRGYPQSPGFGGLLSTGRLPVRIGAIGEDSAHSTAAFDGLIDHVSLWKGALTPAEVFTDFADTANAGPVVDAGPDQTAAEGGIVSFSGSFSDPDSEDTHVLEWDLGDGETASGTLTPTHVYKNDGIYAVTLTVTDNKGMVGSDRLTVTVNNAAPTVSIDSVDQPTADFILSGDMLTFRGSFTDPGIGEVYTIEWDFGDGTGGIAGTLTPSHAYEAPGTYAVVLTITDDDGVGTASIDVLVQSPAGAAEVIIEEVKEMDLPQGTEDSLISKLATATDAFERGQDNAAVNKLEAFIQQVNAQRGKNLTVQEADRLITDAQSILANVWNR